MSALTDAHPRTGSKRCHAAFRDFYEAKNKKARLNAKAAPHRAHEAGSNSHKIRERHLRHLEQKLKDDDTSHIGMLSQGQVDWAFEDCLDSMEPRAGTIISPNTIRSALSSFKTFIRWNIDNGSIPSGRYTWLTENLPDVDAFKRKMLIIRGEDWPEIFRLAGLRHIMDRVILELAFYLAMRISEARMVRWMDLDLENDDVQFYRDKRNDYLRLPVPPELKETLLEVLQWLKDMGTPPEPDWPICLARTRTEFGPIGTVQPHWPIKPGKPVDERVVRIALAEALEAFGIKRSDMICQGMHICRRSRACQLYKLGTDIRVIAKILGHKNFLTTLDYIRDGLDENEIRAAMNTPVKYAGELVPVELSAHNLHVTGDVPAVPQSKEQLAQAMFTMMNSGLMSDEELKVLMMRMIS